MNSLIETPQIGYKSLDNFGPLSNWVNLLKNYGCWCYFDDKYKNGKGITVSMIDASCRDLQNGYQCAVIDGEIEGGNCRCHVYNQQ